MDAVHAGGLGGTYGGNPVACAAALGALETMRTENLCARARAIEALFRHRLDKLQRRYDVIAEIRGRGAMLALELTAANAQRAEVSTVRAVLPDDVPDSVRFAAIWSNPPIRIGKAALHELLLRWLPRLVPGGQAHLVVQRHLGADSLHRWLQESLPAGWTVERAGSAKGYRVLRVTASS
jgi:acetylornithine/succinyldiaminopimelate/putrescine aminotransferase